VVDAGDSRAGQIPLTRNHAGFPEGISGVALLERMREQATLYGTKLVAGLVTDLRPIPQGFTATLADREISARVVLLATGVTNRRPLMDDDLHAEALRQGRLRYCPVCDGYEVTDQVVAVVGRGPRAAREAEFLRGYTADVSLIGLAGEDGLDEAARARLDAIGVKRFAGPVLDFHLEGDGLVVTCPAGRLRFDAVYPSLGSDIHSDLARALGGTVTEEGCIKVDSHQRTSVPGLYAAGDVVLGLDQISHAMGEAGVAATTLRNDLAALAPLLR
jgi:thioredoxin reductase (NADPH)